MADYDWNIFQYFKEASASSKPVILKLIFPDEVKSPVYTRKDIIGKSAGGDGRNIDSNIRVILVDGQTNQQVTTGPAASATVKIVLLPGNFGGSTTVHGGDWTPLDFQNSIIIDWGKKKNIFLGNRTVVLNNGIGTVGEIHIKHDRTPLKTDKFRLGAMVVDCPLEVKEAITDPFEVKDRRNEPKVSRQLLPGDKVSCLMNIGKRGRIVLEDKGVLTVNDFVNMHDSDPRGLQEISKWMTDVRTGQSQHLTHIHQLPSICRLTGQKWETVVHHAKRCRSDNGVEGYGSVGSTSQLSSNSNNVTFFDSIDSYIPQPWEDDISVQDYEVCGLVSLDEDLIGFEPFPEDGTNGVVTRVVLAKKRWKKVRATLWFSLVSCLKAGFGNVGSTLASYAGSKMGATLAD